MMEPGQREFSKREIGLPPILELDLLYQLILVKFLTLALNQNCAWNAQQQSKIWVRTHLNSICGLLDTKKIVPKPMSVLVDPWSAP